MKNILFILLVAYCSDKPTDWSNMGRLTPENLILDQWKEERGTFSKYPVECHYKAILFFEEKEFKEYIQQNVISDGTIAIDVKRGKQFVVRQESVVDTVLEKRAVLRGFRTKLEEGKK